MVNYNLSEVDFIHSVLYVVYFNRHFLSIKPCICGCVKPQTYLLIYNEWGQ